MLVLGRVAFAILRLASRAAVLGLLFLGRLFAFLRFAGGLAAIGRF